MSSNRESFAFYFRLGGYVRTSKFGHTVSADLAPHMVCKCNACESAFERGDGTNNIGQSRYQVRYVHITCMRVDAKDLEGNIVALCWPTKFSLKMGEQIQNKHEDGKFWLNAIASLLAGHHKSISNSPSSGKNKFLFYYCQLI